MRAHRSKYGLRSNLGRTDRTVRYLVGAILIGTLLILNVTGATGESVGWLVLMPLLSIPIVISAIMRWDPVYAMFRISSI